MVEYLIQRVLTFEAEINFFKFSWNYRSKITQKESKGVRNGDPSTLLEKLFKID